MMNLVRFDPFTTMRDFDRLLAASERPSSGWIPRVDVLDQDNNLVVRTEVPGIDPETIDVTVEGGTLTIKGSRSFEAEETEQNYHRKEILEGSFERTIRLPKGIDSEAVAATSKDGILEISIPKRPEILPRKVSVEIQR
ncbi:MAG: Hsp20/alpha crystallin family protein [Acidimicrobiia bacterium]|nr:Hsp20/alpha crystallin family protein [Acidimicrobiia bacterium]MDX2465934.1 Hsp20/alpha crystallin family protein [Acidimicrobiia bacterium]